MIIRLADIESDALAILEGFKDFAERTYFRDLFPETDEGFTQAMSRIVALPDLEFLVADHEDEMVGALGLLYSPYLWNPAVLTATELFWWAKTDAPYRTGSMLINEAMARVEARGAIPVFRALESSPPGVVRKYEKLGMVPVETTYVRLP